MHFCFQAGTQVYLGEPETLLPRASYFDPYEQIHQLNNGNINNTSFDRASFQELYALTSAPSSEILECAPSSSSTSVCSSRSFSPHTPAGSPPFSSSPSPSRMETIPSMHNYDMHVSEHPMHGNSVPEHEDVPPCPQSPHPAPGRPPCPGQCCSVPDVPVSYFLLFLQRVVSINSQLWCLHF